jgi:hypothetical protein
MNIIEESTKKYNGNYSEELTKNVSTPIGRYIYQPKSGILEIDGTKISVNINEVGGAMPVTEPFRITLHLDKTYQTELTIFPKNLWNGLLDFISPKRREFIPKPIRKQFCFGGNNTLIKKLASDRLFVENITNEKIYIQTGNKQTNRITLTPERGIENLNQFEKFVTILKLVENKIKTGGNTV